MASAWNEHARVKEGRILGHAIGGLSESWIQLDKPRLLLENTGSCYVRGWAEAGKTTVF